MALKYMVQLKNKAYFQNVTLEMRVVDCATEHAQAKCPLKRPIQQFSSKLCYNDRLRAITVAQFGQKHSMEYFIVHFCLNVYNSAINPYIVKAFNIPVCS